MASRPSRLPAKLLTGLLFVGLAVSLAVSGVLIVLQRRFPRLLEPDNVPEGAELVAVLVVFLLFVGQVVLRLTTVVVFCIWLYRTVAAAEELSPRPFATTPGWAVGWFFIPFANLFKPYQAVREVYDATNPEAAVDPDAPLLLAGGAPESPWQLKVWWIGWLAMNVLENAGSRLGPQAVYMLLAAAAAIPCTLALVWIIHTLEDHLGLLRERRASAEALSAGALPAGG